MLYGVGITQTVINAMIDFIEPFTFIQNETAGLPLNSQYRLELKTALNFVREGEVSPEILTMQQTVQFGEFWRPILTENSTQFGLTHLSFKLSAHSHHHKGILAEAPVDIDQ